MSRNIYFTLIITFWISIQAVFSQSAIDSANHIKFLSNAIEFLANDSLSGRAVGSKGEELAANYIFNSFKENKSLKVKKQGFEFLLKDSTQKMSSVNVYAFLNNKGDSTIVIGAHYDHIGIGSPLSLAYSNRNQIHNGADDNASGVSLVLLLARNVNKQLSKKYNYLFVCYSAHELGLYGSSSFYQFYSKKKRSKPMAHMFNFDMIGRLNTTRPVLSVFTSSTSSKQLVQSLEQLNSSKINIVVDNNSKLKQTDCKVFDEHKVSSVSFTTGVHSDYHKPTDDESKINYQGIRDIYGLMIDIINSLGKK
jgi:aminopeptidase-like protein